MKIDSSVDGRESPSRYKAVEKHLLSTGLGGASKGRQNELLSTGNCRLGCVNLELSTGICSKTDEGVRKEQIEVIIK